MEMENYYRDNNVRDLVILVNNKDEWIGTAAKLDVHLNGALHRALSIFITNKNGEILLQKRAANKYHSAGLWTNACCSHPRPGEPTESAANRRLREELGIETPLKKVAKTCYKINVGDEKTEHEFDHIFTGEWNGIVVPNPEEVSEVKWIGLSDLDNWLKERPQDFTGWFTTIFAPWKGSVATLTSSV